MGGRLKPPHPHHRQLGPEGINQGGEEGAGLLTIIPVRRAEALKLCLPQTLW